MCFFITCSDDFNSLFVEKIIIISNLFYVHVTCFCNLITVYGNTFLLLFYKILKVPMISVIMQPVTVYSQ